MSSDAELHEALRRVAARLDAAAPPTDVAAAMGRRPPVAPPAAMALLAAAVIVALLVGAVAVLATGGEDEGVRTERPSVPATVDGSTPATWSPVPPTTPVTEPGPVVPPSYEGVAWDVLPEQGLAVVEGDRVLLVDDAGEELGSFPADEVYGVGFDPADRLRIGPDLAVEIVPAAVEGDDGCAAIGGGGTRAAVCGADGEGVVVLAPDGTTTASWGRPLDSDHGHWRFAEPSPDGRWLLAAASFECEVPHAMLLPAGGGVPETADGFAAYPVEDDAPFPATSQAVGWTDDGRAIVVFPETACGSGDPAPGTYLVDPDTGIRTLFRPGSPDRVVRWVRDGQRVELERRLDRARAELGLEAAGGDHGGPGVVGGVVWAGRPVPVTGLPTSSPVRGLVGDRSVEGVTAEEVDGLPVVTLLVGGSDALAFTCGDAVWLLGADGTWVGLAETLRRVAAALIPRLYCTVTDPPDLNP